MGYHSVVEVRFIAFVRVREERELRDTEDISIDILHALLPHRPHRRVVEHAYLETVDGNLCERGMAGNEGRSGVHFIRQDLEVCHRVICAVNACQEVLSLGDKGTDRFLYPPRPSSLWRSQRQPLRRLYTGRP